MPDASYLQQDFRGGKWSPYYQGRIEDPAYRTALNVCLNILPTEEGAATRRPGFRYIAATKRGQPAAIRRFAFAAAQPYDIEFTPGFIRFTVGNSLVLEPTTQNVVSISTADPSVITTAADHGWSTDDEVQFALPAGNYDVGAHLLFNRQFRITVLSATTFSIADSVTNVSVDGSAITLGPAGMLVSRVLCFTAPYTLADLPGIRTIQGSNNGEEFVIILSQAHQPQLLTAPNNPDPAFNSFATFALNPVNFLDGPYLDPVNDGGVLTPSGLGGPTAGVINVTVGYQTWSSSITYGIADTVVEGGIGYISLIDSNLDNDPSTDTAAWQAISPGASVGINGFVATDVGRQIRMYSVPPEWDSSTAYAVNAAVDFGGEFWTALVANTGKKPGLDLTTWAIDASAAVWTWGRIQSLTSPTEVVVQLLGGPLLYDTAGCIQTWQMGRYSETTDWPTCGVYMEGRLWLAAFQFPDHFDGSMSNQTFQWSPSNPDGTVADNNGISETLNDDESNAIFWMIPDSNGIVLGTLGGEWLVQASTLSDPLTPTSIQAKKVTKYGCENIEPKRSGITFMVVQRFAKKLLEFMLNVYNGKYEALNTSERARDLTTNGMSEIAYQRERIPIVWARDTLGALFGMTYKRERNFQTTGPTMWGWHNHVLGGGRQVTGLQSGPNINGDLDSVTVVTWDGVNTNGYWLEVLTDVFDEEATLQEAWFVDEGDVPWAAAVSGSDILLYGYYYLAGQTVAVWIGGVDAGNFTVSADGVITVPFGSGFTAASQDILTPTYFAAITAEGSTFNNLAVFVSNGNASAPAEPVTSAIGEFFTNTYNYSTGGIAGGAVDWKNGLFYVPGANGGTAGISVYHLQAMSPAASASQTQIFGGTTADDTVSVGPIGQDGNMYYMCSSQNSGPLCKLSSGLQLLGKFGVGSGTTHSGATGGMAAPHSACCLSALNQYYLQSSIGTGNALFGGVGCEVAIADGTNMAFVSAWGVDQPTGGVTAGRQTNDGQGHYYAEAFGIFNSVATFALGPFLGAYGTTPLSFWRFTINNNPPNPVATAFTNVASITPANIDPLWNWFSDSKGLVMDQADGNILAYAAIHNPSTWTSQGNDFLLNSVVMGSNGHAYQCTTVSGAKSSDPTTDAGVHWTDLGAPAYVNAAYLYKINSATGAVMWTLALPNVFSAPPMDDQNFNQSLVQNSRLALLVNDGSVGRVLWIDTNAGTILTNTNVTASVDPQGQMIWGPLGLIGAVDYTNSGGSTPIPLSPCTTSFTNHWGLFEATPSTAPFYSLPIVAGYTYTSQAQVLRPVIPQESGTQSGPSLGMPRRVHDLAYLFQGAVGVQGAGVSIGTDFNHLHGCQFRASGPEGAIASTVLQLYNDVYWDKVDDDYSFNGQACWQVTRPYPCTVTALEAMLKTTDMPND